MSGQHNKLTWLLILVVGFLTVSPVFMLIVGSFSEGLTVSGDFTLSKYISAYADPDLFEVLWNTVIFVSGSSLFAVMLALFLAYISVRTDMPFRFLFKIIPVIPLMIPHVLFTISWAMLLNPSNGILNLLLRQLFNLQSSPFNIYTMSGMILVEGLLDMPIAYLVISPAMASFDASLEESSRVSGAGRLLTLTRITLPVLRPAILAAFILCVIRCLASFAVPAVMGMRGRIHVLTTHLYRMISTGFQADYGKAAAIGVSVLVTSIILIYVYRYFTSASERFVTVSSRGYKPSIIELKNAKAPIFVILLLILSVLIVLPVLVLIYISLIPYSMVPSARAFSMMSLRNWIIVLNDPLSLKALKNSLFLGVTGATLGVILSIFVAYVIVKARTKSSGLLESLSFLSFSFPGIVIGVGFMWFFVRTPLYATIWALLIGYIATYLPYGIRPLSSAFTQIHNHLEESSYVAGASFLTTFGKIIVPLLVPGIVSGWILMATMLFRELSLSVILSRPGSEVLAVQILRFAEDGQWGRLSALGIIMIALSTLLVTLVNFIGARIKST